MDATIRETFSMQTTTWYEDKSQMIYADQTHSKSAFEHVIRQHDKNSAKRQWQYQLKRGDTLPRGKFFESKVAGKPIIIIDEAWQLLSKLKW